MKFSKKIIFSLLGIFTLAGSAVYAFGGHGHNPEKRAEHIVEKISKKLALNDVQKAKLVEAKEVILAARKDMHSSKNGMHKNLTDVLSGDTLDREKVLSLINAKTNAVESKAPVIINAVANFYDSLDQEQQAKIRNKVEKHLKHKRHKWKGDKG